MAHAHGNRGKRSHHLPHISPNKDKNLAHDGTRTVNSQSQISSTKGYEKSSTLSGLPPLPSLNRGPGPHSGKAGRGGRQPHAPRRHRSGCHNQEVRKGVGAVLFALGIPTGVAGIIMTVVAATDDSQNGKYPPAFSAVGPVLLVSMFLLLLAGFWLISPVMSNMIDRCFSFEDPKSFCRVNCPRLSHFLHPDHTIIINRAAMEALKTEPGKSVLKRPPAPASTTSSEETDVFTKLPVLADETAATKPRLQEQRSLDSTAPPESNVTRRPGSKGVRFSESDVDDQTSRRGRTISVSSDSSQLSLRHCKIHPKEEYRTIWHTSDNVPEDGAGRGSCTEAMTTEL